MTHSTDFDSLDEKRKTSRIRQSTYVRTHTLIDLSLRCARIAYTFARTSSVSSSDEQERSSTHFSKRITEPHHDRRDTAVHTSQREEPGRRRLGPSRCGPSLGIESTDLAGEYDRLESHRHRGLRRTASLGHGHDGDQRDGLDSSRAARDRADQRVGRRARPSDQDHPGRRRERLAHVCGEGEEATRERPRRGRVRLLDVGIAQSRAAHLRERERPALLPDLLRGIGAVEERHLHRSGSHAADHRGPRLDRQGKGRQDVRTWSARITSGRAPPTRSLASTSRTCSRARWSARSTTRSVTRNSAR